MIVGFEIPKLPDSARAASSKINRKTGAFANSLAVAVRNGARRRASRSAPRPRARILPRRSSALARGETLDDRRRPWSRATSPSLLPEPDAYLQNLHTSNVMRALAEVCS